MKVIKLITGLLALFVCSLSLEAVSYPFKIQKNYEMELVRVAGNGEQYVKVWGTANNVEKAMDMALQNAVAAFIFTGCSGVGSATGISASSIPPLAEFEAYETNKSYFDNFFKKGEFLHYVRNLEAGKYPSGQNNVGVSGGRKVCLYVVVSHDRLRKKLEDDGIIKSLSQSAGITISDRDGKIITAIKPTIMVVPEKAWCIQKGFVKPGTNQVDYEAALLDKDVLNAVTEMGGIMAEHGYPLKHLSSVLDQIKNEAVLDMVLTSKDDGEIVEDDLDHVLRVAQADIMVNIAFDRVLYGPRNYMEFRVTSIDAATSKQIGGNSGKSSTSGAPMSVLLKEAINGFMNNFVASIQRHFDDVSENGREISITFMIADDCPLNFQSDVEYEGDEGELGDLIELWLSENCVNGVFSVSGKTRNRIDFEQVRIPLFGKGGFGGKQQKAINAEGFIKPIKELLDNYDVSMATTPIGVGKVYVVLGGK